MEIFKLPECIPTKFKYIWEHLLLSLAIGTQQMWMAIGIAIDGKLMQVSPCNFPIAANSVKVSTDTQKMVQLSDTQKVIQLNDTQKMTQLNDIQKVTQLNDTHKVTQLNVKQLQAATSDGLPAQPKAFEELVQHMLTLQGTFQSASLPRFS